MSIMRTPIEYKNNLNNGIITADMLSDALYSANKRAKNWRDKKREYKAWERESYHRYDKYNDIGKAEDNEHRMYERKEQLLSLVRPLCIHQECAGYETKRIYDYETNYEDIHFDAYLRGQVTWSNNYYDSKMHLPVEFFDKIDKDRPTFRYYLYYKVSDRTFHSPIDKKDIQKYDLPNLYIDTLETTGYDVAELLSVQFLDKMIKKIQSKEAVYTGGAPDFDWAKARRTSDQIQKNIQAEVSDKYGSEYQIIRLASEEIKNKAEAHCDEYQLTEDDKQTVQAYCLKAFNKKYDKASAKANMKHKSVKECWNDPYPDKNKFLYNDMSIIKLPTGVWRQLKDLNVQIITRQIFADILDQNGVLNVFNNLYAQGKAKNAYYHAIWPQMLKQYKLEKFNEDR